FTAMVASGCSATAPSRFYTLDATATADGTPPVPGGVLVGPVSIPVGVDRPEIVVQVAPNRVDLDEFNRWAAPLGDSIARTVAADLVILLGTSDVATAPLAHFKPAYRVAINVQQFESVPGQSALIDAVWVVQSTGGATRAGRTVARETVAASSYDALAAAH